MVFIFLCSLFALNAWGQEESLPPLSEEPQVVTASRFPRPASLTAENTTVITSAEIAALNAHTLADILNVIPGVQLQMMRTPGSVTDFRVQGSKTSHVLVLIDNVPINNLSDNIADIASIPAQIVEKVEVVKGAASSAWGSALGGVINVITKRAVEERAFDGEISASLGKSLTTDDRAQFSGTIDNLGYYLSGGYLHSNGLQPNNHVSLRDYYAKAQYEFPRATLSVSGLFSNNASGQGSFNLPGTTIDVDQALNQFVGTGSLQYRFSNRLTLEAAVKGRQTHTYISQNVFVNPPGLHMEKKTDVPDSSVGGSISLGWKGDIQRISLGVDYDHGKAHGLPMSVSTTVPIDASADKVGVYFNDLISFDKLAIIPSIRFDHTGTNGDLFSPNLGLTYAITDNTLLRGYVGEGYSLTSLLSNSAEKVWTAQAGFETSEIPFLWLKGTAFRNDTWNITALDPKTRTFVKKEQIKRGFEAELSTVSVFNLSLSGGYTYTQAQDAATNQTLPEIPQHSYKFIATYDNPRIINATLVGTYAEWKASPNGGKATSRTVWDLHLQKRVTATPTVGVELFLSVHNLFNAEQYASEYYKNPALWAEAGVKCRF